ncbi:MAG TPA: hypothetical protein VLE89_05570 [Chlamydiales bacterium]|nr:hypothetical protein [Chlamydiales bacterium]
MTMTIAPAVFQAKWTPANQHLKPLEKTCLQKIARVAWNILSILIPPIGLARLIGYGIGRLANYIILPAAHYPRHIVEKAHRDFQEFWHGENIKSDEQRTLRRFFLARDYTCKTPDYKCRIDDKGVLKITDGADLAITHFQHADAKEETPTIICFQQNGAIKNLICSEPNTPLEELNPYLVLQVASILKRTPCNFVIFDYRSVGDSKGVFKGTKDLEIDSCSIVQWVETALGVPKNQIQFYGASLGGGTSVLAQATDPQLTGPNGNERSFASTEEMIRAILGRTIFKCLSGFIARVVKMQGYDLNPAAAFPKLPGKKLVIYHPEDNVIPFGPSMKKQIGAVEHESLHLEIHPALQRVSRINGHHNTPVHCYNVNGTEESALNRISNFMFNLAPDAKPIIDIRVEDKQPYLALRP